MGFSLSNLDPTNVIKSINEERKRTPLAEFFSDKFNRAAHSSREPEADLEQRYQDMQDYVQYGAQEGRPSFTYSEIQEGPALSIQSGNPGDIYGTGESQFTQSREGGERGQLDQKYYESIGIPADSYLGQQLAATNQNVYGQSMGQTPNSIPQQNYQAANANRPDFSQANPFAQYAQKAGFSDFQGGTRANSSPANLGKGLGMQSAISTALRGGNS